MARPKRFELLTARFVAEYSIQLSYGRILFCLHIIGCFLLLVNLNFYQINNFKRGGERGIRTLDALLAHTPLAGERLRPLGHLS